jgi:hypothetical protein
MDIINSCKSAAHVPQCVRIAVDGVTLTAPVLIHKAAFPLHSRWFLGYHKAMRLEAREPWYTEFRPFVITNFNIYIIFPYRVKDYDKTK